MNTVTQDMRYRQSLMKYAQKYGVSRASRKYNKNRSYIYFWQKRWDGTLESLACQSRKPHSHPNQHTEAEIKLIQDMRRRNPQLGLTELWHRLRKRDYTRRPESLFRLMRRLGMFPQAKSKKKYVPNLNQLAKVAHAERYIDADKYKIIASLLFKRVDEIDSAVSKPISIEEYENGDH